ncbi:MAG: type II secretion system F family protein [Planctomycetales bacterium]
MSSKSHTSVSLEQLVALNDEIAALVRGGVPLELGLRDLGADAGGMLGSISAALGARMQSGQSLTEALEAEQPRIPRVYKTVVEAGLRAGRLSAALEAMSNFARELVDLRRQIGLALIYPLIVLVLAYGLFAVVTVDLAERFRETYEMLQIPMHGPLQWLVWVAERFSLWWWWPPAILGSLIVWWFSTGGGQLLSLSGTARPLRWIPGVGRIGREFQIANFAELLALLMEHQVPLPEALRLSADATGDRPLRQAAKEFATAVEQGRETAAVARGSASWPPWLELALWPWLLLLAAFRLFDAYPPRFPPFLHWVLCQAGSERQPVRLLRHSAGFYRRRALNLARWVNLVFPLLASVFIGGGMAALYALSVFGPLASFWNDLMQ